jgi:hypothetical protein
VLRGQTGAQLTAVPDDYPPLPWRPEGTN